MIIGKDCEPYLQSDRVISILQSADPGAHTTVFKCLRRLKNYFNAALFMPGEIFEKHAEDAYSMAELIFFDNVRKDRFKPITPGKFDCVAYVKEIYKRIYFKLYVKEVKKRNLSPEYLNDKKLYISENTGEKRLLEKDYLSLKIEALLKTMSEEDNKIYRLVYVERANRTEIAAVLQILPAAVWTKLHRFHTRFREAWIKYKN